MAEAYYDYELALGRHREILSELSALVAGEPLRERPVGQLMLALYRSGRQTDALARYRQTRAVLDRELGLEPGSKTRPEPVAAQKKKKKQSVVITSCAPLPRCAPASPGPAGSARIPPVPQSAVWADG